MRHFLHNSERAMVATRSATVRATSSKRGVAVETERTSKRQRVETYTVGPAVLGDTEPLKNLMNGPAFSQVYTKKAHKVPFIESAFLQGAITDPDRIVLVIRLLKTNTIVGYAYALKTDWYFYLSELFVLVEHRGQGLGQQLVHGVLDAAKSRKGTQCVSEVKLEAEKDGLVLFYKTLGFEMEEGSSTSMRFVLSREASNRARC